MEKVKKFKPTLAQKAGVVATAVLASNMANAADPIDVSAVVSTITGGVAIVSSIGLAGLSLVVVIKLFKWAKQAL